MDDKKNLGMQVTISVVVTFLGCVVLSILFFRRISMLQHQTITPTPTVATASADFMSLQNTLLATIADASQAVVTIGISNDLKSYIQDPSQQVAPSSIQDQQAKLGGASGILISKDGYVLTNKHVVDDTGTKYEVTLNNNDTYQVSNIWFDDTLDLAVLKIINDKGASPDSLPVAHFIPFDQPPAIGQFVLAIGNALNEYPNSVTFGILSAKNRTFKINNTNIYAGLYQTDASLSPGNSGGPLLDLQGQVLGITTAIAQGQSIGFALPVSKEFIDTTIASLAKYGKIVRPLLGIQYIDLTQSLQKEKNLPVAAGALINDVLTGLPAAQAGIKPGDIVIAINDKQISPQLPLLYQIYTYLPGSTVSFTVMRNGETIKVPVVLGENGT